MIQAKDTLKMHAVQKILASPFTILFDRNRNFCCKKMFHEIKMFLQTSRKAYELKFTKPRRRMSSPDFDLTSIWVRDHNDRALFN